MTDSAWTLRNRHAWLRGLRQIEPVRFIEGGLSSDVDSGFTGLGLVLTIMSVGYPIPTASFPAARARPPSAGSAETLVLIALILQVIGGVLLTGGIVWLFGFSVIHPFPYAWAAVTAAVTVGVIVLVFLYFAYTLSYQRIQRGDYSGAQTPTLIIGILSLFAGLIPGIFYLVGYVKIGDAIREQQSPLPGQGTLSPVLAPAALVACKGCGRVHPLGQFAFCPNCGQKLGA